MCRINEFNILGNATETTEEREGEKKGRTEHDKTSIEQIIFCLLVQKYLYVTVKRKQSDVISLIMMTENEDETLKRDE